MNNYKQVYKNLGLVPRTLDEATRNATYASPITHPVNDELQDALDFFSGFLIGAIYIGFGASVAVGILMFFGVVVIK
jgi:hypothetical protein